MTFTFNIPQVGQSLGSSRSQILNNFTNLATTIAVNHGGVNGPNNGKHLQVEMPRQTVTPTTLANEGTLYTALAPGPTGINTDMFYTVDADATKTYRMSRIDLAKFALFATNTNYPPNTPNQDGGYTFLPGGLLLQYGTMKSTGNQTTIGYPIAFQTVPFSIVGTRSQNSTSDSAWGIPFSTVTNTSFRFDSDSNQVNAAIYWMAIGI